MRTITLIIGLLFRGSAQAEQLADLAPEWRQSNWGWPGSCGHASTISDLRWLQMFTEANTWRHEHSGGLGLTEHLKMLDAKGIKYVATGDGDRRVLDYAIQSRRGAIIYWGPKGGHITYMVGKENGDVVILDNNHVKAYTRIEFEKWIPSWGRQGGGAIVITSGQVPPPAPE